MSWPSGTTPKTISSSRSGTPQGGLRSTPSARHRHPAPDRVRALRTSTRSERAGACSRRAMRSRPSRCRSSRGPAGARRERGPAGRDPAAARSFRWAGWSSAGRWGVRSAGLNRLAAEVEGLPLTAASRSICAHVPIEAAPLVLAMNRLIERLRRSPGPAAQIPVGRRPRAAHAPHGASSLQIGNLERQPGGTTAIGDLTICGKASNAPRSWSSNCSASPVTMPPPTPDQRVEC